ncbi:MAG: YjjG family noncanonical pyrimidine nucleotidase [Chryseolinea sp.]
MQTENSKSYKAVFFDLDHTLWDYETNSRETLIELYSGYQLSTKGIASVDEFLDQFRLVNAGLWYLYDNGKIDSTVIRRERFKQILEHFSAYEEGLSISLSVDYLDQCPKKGNLMPHAIEVLNYLAPRYRLTVITNGFEEIQHLKLKAGNLHTYFDHIVTSQKAGHRKPDKKIFDFALENNNVKCNEAIMIGDNLITDVGGARNAGIANVFFNSEKIGHSDFPDHEIERLIELQGIL